MKTLIEMKQKANGLFVKAGVGASALAASGMAAAQEAGIDTTAVQTAIDAAESDALTTGEYVIGAVASLVVVGLIIAMVRKL